MTNRIYTRFALLAALCVAIFLALTGCTSELETCRQQAARFPAGMVADYRVVNGACEVQINYADGTPGAWFPMSAFDEGLTELGY